MNRFAGRKILITGGTRGIGKAAASAFLDEGAHVVIAGRTQSSLTTALAEMQHGRLSGVAGDVSSVEQCNRIVQYCIEHLDGLDVLVNSAGVFQHANMVDTDEAIWDNIMDVNLKGSYFCSRAAVPELQKNGGVIIHLASESGINGYCGSTVYCASKGAIVNLTRSMAVELAPEVRVNAVCPGVVETDMARAGFAIDGNEELGMEQQRNSYPLQRVASAPEIAAAILYLASDDARFITGESLVMDGGATVGK